jgi:hypothetical protein
MWCPVALVRTTTANVVPTSLILFTVIMEATHSSETSVLTRASWCHIQEDSIQHINYLIFEFILFIFVYDFFDSAVNNSRKGANDTKNKKLRGP